MLDKTSGYEIEKARMKQWLVARMKRGECEVFAELVMITPVLAEIMLENNIDNRTLKQGAIDQLANDLRNGHWRVNGETIIVAKDGALNDGQHRLWAILTSGVSAAALIAFGVERETRNTVDIGAVRTPGDLLSLDKVGNANSAAAVARMIYGYHRGVYHINLKNGPTKPEIVLQYRLHKDLIDEAVRASQNSPWARTIGLTPIAAAYVILCEHSPINAPEFLASLLTGSNLSPGNPILFCRERLTAARDERWRTIEKFVMILRVWNAWRTNSVIKQYKHLAAYPELRP